MPMFISQAVTHFALIFLAVLSVGLSKHIALAGEAKFVAFIDANIPGRLLSHEYNVRLLLRRRVFTFLWVANQPKRIRIQ